MTRVTPVEFRDIARQIFLPRISEDLGVDGVGWLATLLEQVRNLHRAVSTERLEKGVTVVYVEDPSVRLAVDPPVYLTQCTHLTSMHNGAEPLSVQLAHDGGLYVWNSQFDIGRLNGRYVAYEYRGPRQEFFRTPAREHPVPVLAAAPSFFAVPYFRDLNDALITYGWQQAKKSRCPILSRVWRDESRVCFAPKPEHHMRRSLQEYLRTSLRDSPTVSVMPEQNVDETHPVDLKVTWTEENRVALIEVKWLGRSVDVGGTTERSTYSASRAVDGAVQLADYLDRYSDESREDETRGYLTVFDARRRAVGADRVSVNPEGAYWYKDREIEYPEDIVSRPDFAYPVRFFCEPNLSAP